MVSKNRKQKPGTIKRNTYTYLKIQWALVPPIPKELIAMRPPSNGVVSVTTLSLPSNRPGMFGLGVLKCRFGGIARECMMIIHLDIPAMPGQYEKKGNFLCEMDFVSLYVYHSLKV